MSSSSIKWFEVDTSGIVGEADFEESITRAEVYSDVAESWRPSPQALIDATEECYPLLSAVESAYHAMYSSMQRELDSLAGNDKSTKAQKKALSERLAALPEEPEEGAVDWVLSLTQAEFERDVVPVIESWFEEQPDPSQEEFSLGSLTAEGKAYDYFSSRDRVVAALHLVLIEGDHPGSDVCYVKMKISVAEANRIAADSGLPVRFREG
jgi:hypothetical protein